MNSSTCFEHCCAHHQEVKIVLYSIWYRYTLYVAVRCAGAGAPEGHLQSVTIPDAA